MTEQERWQRIKELHFAARELAGPERQRFLAANCATPQERDEVEERLKSNAPTDFLATPVLGAALGEWARLSEFRVGDRFGKYEIQGALGAGGGGKVYRALDSSLHRQVAIKVLLPEASSDAISRQRFVREAEAASALNHPNIVTVYEIGVENGIDYIAMEYIAGKSLRQSIAKRGLRLAQFFPWAIQIADGLAVAHAAGIIHRDVKPGNVMITDRGSAKIVDFGLAKSARPVDEATGETLTREGAVAGTSSYMAPEQVEAQALDSRADIFGLGCVFYEMITGRRAFEGESQLSTVARILHHEPAPVRDVVPLCPPGLERLILLCLRKKREERWQNAGDVRLMLEQLQQDWKAGTAGAAEERKRTHGPRWQWAAWLLAGALLAAGGLYWLLPGKGRTSEVRLTELTMDGGLTTFPSISADGRLLVYASDRSGDGNLDIWVQQVGGRSPIRLTSDPADEKDPDISPDGMQVVFRSERDDGGIYVMPALGGEPVLLAQGGRNPRFSPDGKWIAYWVGKEGVRMPAGSAHVFAIPAGGGQPTALGADLAAAMYPVWSPGGDKVIVVGRKNANIRTEPDPDWWVLPAGQGTSVSTGALKRVLDDARGLRAPGWQHNMVPLAWRKSGMVFFTAQYGDAANLWSVDVDAATARSSGRASRVTAGTTAETHAAFAVIGGSEAMVFTSSVLQFDIWTIPMDLEHGDSRGEIRRITDDMAWELHPSLSWDGSKLAFGSKRGGVFSLSVRDLQSGKDTSLLTSPNLLRSRLSGDGQWLFYGEYPGNILRIPTRGGVAERLCERCGTPTSVSFDGSRVVLEPVDSPEDVQEMDVKTRKISTLVPARDSLYNGEISRDGKWVLFTSKGPANSRVFIARVEDGRAAQPSNWIPITEADGTYQGPHWSPGGGAVYFLSERDGFRCLWARRLDAATKVPAGPIFAVQHFHHARRSLQHVRSFDGSTVAVGANMALVVLGELTGNIWMREQKLP